jgi:hypothetical protein
LHRVIGEDRAYDAAQNDSAGREQQNPEVDHQERLFAEKMGVLSELALKKGLQIDTPSEFRRQSALMSFPGRRRGTPTWHPS